MTQRTDEDGGLTGRVALVTGAGKGIGAATAVQLAAAGARVALAARTDGDLAKIAAFIHESGGEALPVRCDVTDEAAVDNLFREVGDRLGPVDVLVNNAGQALAGPFHEQATADWRRVLDANLVSTLLCARAALRDMRPRGRGVIVNVASVSGVAGVEKLPGLCVYAAAKAGVIAFSEALAAEARPHGVRVLCVSPGAVKTDGLRAVAPPELVEKAMTPGRVAGVIAFLCGDVASAVTGSNVVVWGPPAAAAAPPT
ncbi:MAG: SDR family oxidoreductase [Planctomycetes bacterium]|nr:SDR family oxidoreductase [Planctomycetota bacterium]